jgi:hypothetical protein
MSRERSTETPGSADRGVSHVVASLLVAGIIVRARRRDGVRAVDETTPAPTATLEVTASDCRQEPEHAAGDSIDGDRAELVGVGVPEAVRGRQLTGGDSPTLDVTAGQVELQWRVR